MLFDNDVELFKDKQLVIMNTDDLITFHFDSKRFDCITTIFDENSFLDFFIMEKTSHLFGTHIVYGKNATIDFTWSMVNALLNKPIFRYSKDQNEVCETYIHIM